jgi:hypothetical protein
LLFTQVAEVAEQDQARQVPVPHLTADLREVALQPHHQQPHLLVGEVVVVVGQVHLPMPEMVQVALL